MIYLDNAATTYPKPEAVYKAMEDANRNMAFNAGRGSYAAAREATKLIDETKQLLLKLVHALPGANVAFTPSITIALNEIIQGVEIKSGDNIYVTPYEHNAVARVCELVAKSKGANVIQLPLKNDTLEINLDEINYLFAKNRPALVCAIHVSNVTGYILPIAEIFDTAKAYGAITVLDTAQSLGLVDVDLTEIKADYVAFAGHKSLYGPFGVGGIISASSKTRLDAVFAGGTGSNSLNLEMPEKAPERYEYASPNIVAIAGLNAALKELDVQQNYIQEKSITDDLVMRLQAIDGVIVYNPPSSCHIGVVSFNVEGFLAEDIGMILDQDYSIAVRTGYHCAPYVHSYLEDKSYTGTVRVGVGRYTSKSDILMLESAINDLI